MTDFTPTISVVINTLNRADLLVDALRGLTALDWPDLEIVVVNGPSTDGTEEVLTAWSGRIKIGQCPDANLARSRNIGLAQSAGEIIAFLDDDSVPHPRWLSALVEHYRDPTVGAVGGHTIGRLGSTYQARTTLCDRFGDAHFVSDLLDLSAFCQPGSWIYPSLLGTNSSMRRTAIEGIGGFDEVFSYYLDETDVCLRLVDAGWQIAYAPEALVWHQFASSALRSANMTRRSIKEIIRSQCYFINKHGTQPWSPEVAKSAVDRLLTLRRQWLGGNHALLTDGAIDARHRSKLDRELDEGLQEGFRLAQANAISARGDWTPAPPPPFKSFVAIGNRPLTIAFVCRRAWHEIESGIPRWTRLLAEALADRGHRIHVISETDEPDIQIQFRDGLWQHRIPSDAANYGWIVERYGLPADQAQWAASVHRHVEMIRSFGLDIVSFPIWDLEGVGCFSLPGLAVAMSLHTSYGLSAPLRPDWSSRPIFRDAVAKPMINAENLVLAQAPHLLANSQSILRELERQSGQQLSNRARIAVHGVSHMNGMPSKPGNLILFVGRFELRKGIDIALATVATALSENENLRAVFVGGGDYAALIAPPLLTDIARFEEQGRISFAGIVDRQTLNGFYTAADVALLPSRYESFGLVAIEAMAAGCAVLGLDIGGFAEVVNSGIDGILVPADDHASAALAQGIHSLFADPGRLRDMQQAALDAARKRFSIERMASEVEHALLQFVDGKDTCVDVSAA